MSELALGDRVLVIEELRAPELAHFKRVVDVFLDGNLGSFESDNELVRSFLEIENFLRGGVQEFDDDYMNKLRNSFESSPGGPTKISLPSTGGRLRLQIIPRRGRGGVMMECVGHGDSNQEELQELKRMNGKLKNMANELGEGYLVQGAPILTISRN